MVFRPTSDQPLNGEERFTYIGFLVLVCGLFIAEIWRDYEPAKLSGLLAVLFWFPLLALHELGHAAAAAGLGWHVGQVVIGMGRKLITFRLGSAVIEIRAVPIEGFVKSVPTNLRQPHLKSALIYLAGPGVELVLAAVVLAAIGPARMFAKTDAYLIIALQSLALIATTQAVLNLLPHSIYLSPSDQQGIPNDGLGILRSFQYPESHYARLIGQQYDPRANKWGPADGGKPSD